MNHRRIRQLVLLAASPAVPGLWIAQVGDDLDRGLPILIAAGLLAGLVTSSRVRLVGPYALGGADAPLRHRQRSVAGDLALVSVAVLGLALVATFIAVARGEDDATIWLVAPMLALLGGGSALLGFLVGALVVVPVATLVGLAIGRGSPPVLRSQVLTCLLLPTITAFSTCLALAVDAAGSSRQFPARSLPALLAGADSDTATVTSHPLLWAARGALLLLVVEGVLLVRASRSEAQQR